MSEPPVSRLGAPLGACAWVAVASMLLVSAWTILLVHYVFNGNLTGLFFTGANLSVPPDLEAGTYRAPAEGYDGQFYRYLAHDPFLQRDYARYVDAPQLRFRRVLVPLAAWLLAFGRQNWIDIAYFAVEMLFLAFGAHCCARLFERRGQSALWGFLFLAIPATLASFDRMLVDGPLLALFAGFLLYCEEGRWALVWLLAMLAALTRETGLLLIAALVADRLIHRDSRRALWFMSAAIPSALWWIYCSIRLPSRPPLSIFAIPGWGIIRRLFWLRPYPDPALQLLLRITDILAVLGLAISFIVAVNWLRRSHVSPITISVGFFAVLLLVLGAPSHMQDAFGFARPVSPLLLWVAIEAVARRKWLALAPPLAPSLSVGLAFAVPFVAVVKGLLVH